MLLFQVFERDHRADAQLGVAIVSGGRLDALAQIRGQIGGIEPVGGGENDGALDGVVEFPQVAGPGVAPEQGFGGGREPADLPPAALAQCFR